MSKLFNPAYLNRLKKIHQYIQEELTGTPSELAIKLNISERSVYLMLEYLKDIGAEINYDKSCKTYYYQKEFDLIITFSIKCITNNEMRIIEGGRFYSTARILQRTRLVL